MAWAFDNAGWAVSFMSILLAGSLCMGLGTMIVAIWARCEVLLRLKEKGWRVLELPW